MTVCVAFQRVFIVVSVYFVIDSDRKLWIHLRMSPFFYVMQSCVGRGVAMGRSPIQGVI
jgi:hypothetical protein